MGSAQYLFLDSFTIALNNKYFKYFPTRMMTRILPHDDARAFSANTLILIGI